MRSALLISCAVGMLLYAPDLVYACDPIAGNAADASSITVFLSVKQGQIWADQVSEFCPSPAYKSRRKDYSQDSEILFQLLRTAMKDLPKFYVYGLSNIGRRLDLKDELKDSDTTKLSAATQQRSEWKAFMKGVQNWLDEYKSGYLNQKQTIVSTGQDGKALAMVKYFIYPSAGKPSGLTTVLKDSALYLPDRTSDDATETVLTSFNQGKITFKIIDPIGNWSDSSNYRFVLPSHEAGGDGNKIDLACRHSPAAVIRSQQVVDSLKDLEGQLWNKSAIVDRLTDLFQRTGFSHTADVSQPDTGTRPIEVKIGGAAQLLLVRLMMRGSDLDSINRALYTVLPTSQFRYVVEHEADPPWKVVSAKGSDNPLSFVDLCLTNIEPKTFPYLRDDQLAAFPKQLDEAGFKFDTTTYGTSNVCGLNIPVANSVVFLITPRVAVGSKSGEQAQKPKSATEQSSSPRVPPGQRGPAKVYTSRLPAPPEIISNTIPPVSEALDDAEAGSPAAARTPAKGSNYVGFGLAYLPNQGVRFVGQYQRVLPNLQVISLEAGTESAALGSGSYHKDFLWFDQIHHRLQLDANGGTNYTHNRLFNGVQTNERRTGGSGSLSLEWIRNDKGFHADSTLSAGSSNVTLSNVAGQQSQRLTYVDVSSSFVYFSDHAQLTQIHIQPTVRFGVTSFASRAGFVSGSISADLLRYLTPAWMPDFRLEITPRFQGATTGTPEYEAPSIGGAETVRGFRADASLARLAATIQNELWIPSTGSKRYHERFLDFLSHKVWIAPFFDYGYSAQTVSGVSGSLLGPGIGGRILLGAALFKLDWGYGLYNGPSGLGGSKFSLDVKTTLPF